MEKDNGDNDTTDMRPTRRYTNVADQLGSPRLAFRAFPCDREIGRSTVGTRTSCTDMLKHSLTAKGMLDELQKGSRAGITRHTMFATDMSEATMKHKGPSMRASNTRRRNFPSRAPRCAGQHPEPAGEAKHCAPTRPATCHRKSCSWSRDPGRCERRSQPWPSLEPQDAESHERSLVRWSTQSGGRIGAIGLSECLGIADRMQPRTSATKGLPRRALKVMGSESRRHRHSIPRKQRNKTPSSRA